ncbi:MAG TPA: peptidoglycan DD-metalloendopeptidase family protein [Gaiellaceae bacterium]|nr:peptidoglycan DD-metalloendopeptidase family protein [Gaiellaceae bacterium]
MPRRLLFLLALALVAAAPAAADNIHRKKASVDAQLAHVQKQLARSKQQESHLAGQVSSLTRSIRRIELQVGGVSQRLSALERDIALHRERLARLDELLGVQTRRFRQLRRRYHIAVVRLDERLVHIYEQPAPTTLDVVLAAKSFQDVLNQMSYLDAIAAQDKRVASEVKAAKAQAAAGRRRTISARRKVSVETQVIRGRAQQVEILRAQLVSSRSRLAGLRGAKQQSLVATRSDIRREVGESQALQAASDRLAAQLRAQQSVSSPATTSGSGAVAAAGAPHFVWPVSGPITSPFGMRWGTLHPGIVIGVPTGTPVHASAAGKVVWCGWMSGYGNFVVLDNGGGFATAYGHNSRIAVHCGEEVAQGQVISYSGCTGFCTGPHVHFEIRVDGTPVDPLTYLG